jgi:hypothetical protein
MAGEVSYLLRPVDEEGWELWSFAENKRATFVRRLANASDAPGETIVALPVRQTLSFPTWLATGDKTLVPEMLRLQLEQRGLLGKQNNGSSLEVRIIENHENESLAIASVLQPGFPKELTFERAVRFEPAPFTFALPQDRLIVWRENGRLAMAVTRGQNAVHFQGLSDRDLSEAIVREIKCALLQLEASRVCGRLRGATLWGNFSDDEVNRLQRVTGLKAHRDAVPPPILPAVASKLVPPEVEVLHGRKRRRKQIRLAVLAILSLYFLGVLALVAHLGWLRMEAGWIRQRLDGQKPTVAAIQSTADRWRRVEWAVNPKIYAVELLNQVAALLPPDGLRLTDFELQKGKVSIRGEASTAPAAFKFAEDIKAAPDLQMFDWQMPSPQLRPDGRANFTIEGDPKVAKID